MCFQETQYRGMKLFYLIIKKLIILAQELHELCFMYIYFRRGKVQEIRITSLRIYLPDKPRNNNSNYYIYFRKGLP